MALVIRTEMLDDLDGEAAEETVSFGLDGTRYEIDLSGEHAEVLRERLARFIEAARRVPAPGAAGKRRGGGRSVTQRETPRLIRAWAAEQGIEVSGRGRISDEIIEQYHAAQR